MKTGKTLNELAAELQRQVESKRDFIANTAALTVSPRVDAEEKPQPGQFELHGLPDVGDLLIGETAHEQLAAHLKIPRPYYDRMRAEQPGLLAVNVNTWLDAHPERRMVRTLDGKARGFLSDRYRPLDSFDLAEATLPIFTEVGAEVVSCELTERRMYIKTILPSLQAPIKGSARGRGDIVRGGVMISNSEIGEGALKVEGFVDLLICINGMIRTDVSKKKYHVGRKAEALELEEAWEHFTTRTRKLDDAAFFAKVQDIVRAGFNEPAFFEYVKRLEETTQEKIVSNDMMKVIEVTRRRFSLSERTGQTVLGHLLRGGDLSQWGLANAITRSAEDEESYDDATALERIGGQVIELPRSEWREIAEAA